MLKRQESSLSASRRQAVAGSTPSPAESHHAKAIGCMSGIIQLFSKYQNSNRRLTFGKKQEKQRKQPPSPATVFNATQDDDNSVLQIKVLRSPTLPPEIRRSNAARSPENPRTPSSLVARLMGLEDLGAAAAKRPENSITEKRRRLLQALEKCNEDLEALKKIIKAVQTAEVRVQPPPPAKRNGGSPACMKIPVDEITRSPVNSCSAVLQNSAAGTVRLRKATAAKKPGEEDEDLARILSKSTMMESALEMRRRAAAAAASPPWSSRAMIESVEEVCNDVAWGEKREMGRMGVVVQDHVCRELIEELVNDLKSCPTLLPLPLEACKRRLCF